MKKIIIIFSGILTSILLALFAFKKYYFNPEKIKERQIETWTKRVQDLENTKSGKTDLTDKINLRWTIKEFDKENHKIEYCENEYQDAQYICKIDNKLWYGSDFRMDLPKNELKKLSIFINNKYLELDVSEMFNPNLSGELNKDQFKIVKKSNYYILYGYFSDGAGTYTTNWKIEDGKSFRGTISKDEEDFEWQNSN